MQKALEQALDSAACILESAQQRPPKRKCLSSGEKSLHDKLYDIYVEECGKEPEVAEELTSNVNLLEKLVKRESLPCLVVNLYPGKEGYSLMLKGENEIYTETIQLPYEEGEFLEYLDAEQLPPVLVDLLEKSQVNIFHRGCVIAEIRDYRQCSDVEPPGYQSRHILLRPTMQTLASDIHSITGDNQVWTQEDKLELESQLILATAEPLCLDPSISVACTENRLLYNKQKMNTPPMRKNLKRYSKASPNQQQELSSSPRPPEIGDFHRKSQESQAGQQHDLKLTEAESSVDIWEQLLSDLADTSVVDVENYAIQESSFDYDDSQPTFWSAKKEEDDFLFEHETGDQSQKAKLPFMKSLNDPFISGIEPCKKISASPCYSILDEHSYSVLSAPKTNARKVVSWLEELVQEDTPCPDQVPQGSSGSASLSQPSPGREAEWPQAMSVQSLVLGEAAQYTPPSISPLSRSGSTSSGDIFTLLQASSPHKSPSPAPASMPASLPQMSSAEVNGANTLPAAKLSTASSSETRASQVRATSAGPNVVQLVGPVHVVPAVVRGSSPMQGSTPEAGAPAVAKPSSLPSGGQPPNLGLAAPQATSQGCIQYISGNFTGLKPIGLLWVPHGSNVGSTQQETQQLRSQHMPRPQLQQPPSFPSQQSVPQDSSARGSSCQRMILPAQSSAVINPDGAGSVLRAQASVLSQPGSAQTGRGQSLPQQTVQLPSARQQQPQTQQVLLRILRLTVPVQTAAAGTSQPGEARRQQARQSKNKPTQMTSCEEEFMLGLWDQPDP